MAKKQQARIGTLITISRNVPVEYTGTLIEQTAEALTIDVKRPRSSKYDRHVFPIAQVVESYLAGEGEPSTIYVMGDLTNEVAGVELQEINGGYFAGTIGEQAVLVGPGRWSFIEDAEAEEEGSKGKGAGKAASKPAPAKGKGKKDEDEEPESEEEEGEEEEEAFEPEEGSYVNVNDGEDDVQGEVTGLTSKKITITDADGEEHSFALSKVTVTEADKPKAKKGGAKSKPKADEEEEEEEAPKGKGGKAGAAKGKGKADEDEWD